MSGRVPLYALLICLIVLNVGGCLPIPLPAGDTSETRQNIGDGVPEFIVVGKTTRADVLLTLGEPDGASEHGAQFTYTRVTSKGGVFGLLVGSYPGVAGAGTARMAYRRLIITFDHQDVVASARIEMAACRESFLQGTSSRPCVDAQGRDVTSFDTLETEKVSHVRTFPSLYWYEGVRGFHSFRGFKALLSSKGIDEFRRHTPGILVVGQAHIYFFPPNADRDTAPILKLSYKDIAEVSLDRFLGGHTLVCIVLKRNSGAYEPRRPLQIPPPVARSKSPTDGGGRVMITPWRPAWQGVLQLPSVASSSPRTSAGSRGA